MSDPASNPESSESSRQHPSRRRFLKGGAALGAALVAGAGLPLAGRAQPAPDDPSKVLGGPLRPYGERFPFEPQSRVTQAKPAERGGGFTPLDETLGIVTPSALHYVVQRGGRPDIDPRQHRLLISGLVDRPVILTVEELKTPAVHLAHPLPQVSGNSRIGRPPTPKSVQGTHGLTACSEWTGVPLALLLREAGVQPGATWIVAEGADATGNERSLPLAKAMDDVLVAYGQNGEALRPDNGYPLRLIVPGWEGNVNVKWLRRLTLVDRPYMTRMESTATLASCRTARRGSSALSWKTKSVITFPSGGQQLGGPGFLRNPGPGVVGSRAGPPGGGLGGRWQDVAGRQTPGPGPAARPHALPARLAVERARGRPAIAVHRRDRLCAANTGRGGQGPWPELRVLQQHHPELEGGRRWEHAHCPGLSCRGERASWHS